MRAPTRRAPSKNSNEGCEDVASGRDMRRRYQHAETARSPLSVPTPALFPQPHCPHTRRYDKSGRTCSTSPRELGCERNGENGGATVSLPEQSLPTPTAPHGTQRTGRGHHLEMRSTCSGGGGTGSNRDRWMHDQTLTAPSAHPGVPCHQTTAPRHHSTITPRHRSSSSSNATAAT